MSAYCPALGPSSLNMTIDMKMAIRGCTEGRGNSQLSITWADSGFSPRNHEAFVYVGEILPIQPCSNHGYQTVHLGPHLVVDPDQTTDLEQQ